MSDHNTEVAVTSAGVFAAGKKIAPAAPATAIADISEVEAVFSAEERGKVNLLLAACRAAGIIAN